LGVGVWRRSVGRPGAGRPSVAERDPGVEQTSADTKKKELVGEFKAGAREWAPPDRASHVHLHLDQLARQAADQLPGDHQPDPRHNHQQGSEGLRPTRRERLPTKLKVTDAELAAVDFERHSFHGDWNYTVTIIIKQSDN
jgi:hypothetical protein